MKRVGVFYLSLLLYVYAIVFRSTVCIQDPASNSFLSQWMVDKPVDPTGTIIVLLLKFFSVYVAETDIENPDFNRFLFRY